MKQLDQGESGETTEPAESFRFVVGDRVCLLQSVPYLKTADPMPMLRPPDLVATGEVGAVSEIRVPATHTKVHHHPRAIAEVRRILIQHLAETSPAQASATGRAGSGTAAIVPVPATGP